MTAPARKIEALLFLAGEAVKISELAELTGQTTTEALATLQELRQALQDHGVTIIQTSTHAQLTTSSSVSDYVGQFIIEEAKRLSPAAAETLAIIAYRGPVSRLAVEAIRGVDCQRMIRQLLVRGLIRRQAKTGRLPTYTITEEFLQHLGLTAREELPRFEELATLPHLAEPS